MLRCVVHYNSLNTSKEIKPLTQATLNTLKENKKARIQLGGANEHSKQCQSVPNVCDPTKHGYHRTCYKKFTKGASILKKKKKIHPTKERTLRSGHGANQLFPHICMICKSAEIKRYYKGGSHIHEKIHKIGLESAEDLIIKAAKESNDDLMQKLVADGKLCEREFQYHNICYYNYTNPYRYSNK